MRNKNFSSWADDVTLEDLTNEAGEYNLSMDLIEDVRDVLCKKPARAVKRNKQVKVRKECWQ